MCVCVCVRTLLSIYMSKISGRDHENLYVCVYICVGFFFIIITLVDLHNTHVLNYTINNNKKIAYQTPENFLKLIFKVITKHRKIR